MTLVLGTDLLVLFTPSWDQLGAAIPKGHSMIGR